MITVKENKIFKKKNRSRKEHYEIEKHYDKEKSL